MDIFVMEILGEFFRIFEKKIGLIEYLEEWLFGTLLGLLQT